VPELRWHRQALPERRQRLGLAGTTMGSTIGLCAADGGCPAALDS
jgi:hypothetical protein